MKYIVIPILKFFGALLLTLVLAIWFVPAPLIYMIWEGKRIPDDFFEINFLQSGNGIWFSPYTLESDCKYRHWYCFKSVFHFIWGFPPVKITENYDY